MEKEVLWFYLDGCVCTRALPWDRADLSCPNSFNWGLLMPTWLSCGLFILCLLKPRVDFFADVSFFGFVAVLYTSQSFPHHARPHDKSTGSKLASMILKKWELEFSPVWPHHVSLIDMLARLFVGIKSPCRSVTSPKPHSFGLLFHLSNAFVTF